jgi:VanZ family protein
MPLERRGGKKGGRPSVPLRALVLCLWMAFIWGHSLRDGTASSGESDFFARLKPIMDLLGAMGVTSWSDRTFLVRKMAHFIEYTVLGIFGWRLSNAMRTKSRAATRLIALLVCLVPVVDEAIQLFVPGRSGRVTDVLLDLSGVAFGAVLSLAISKIARR